MSNEIQQIIVYRNPLEAPVGERDAYEAWKLSMKPYGFDGFDAYQAGAAHQRAQQPQSAEAVSAQARFRRPEKGMPSWSVWQQTSIKPNMPAWSIDSAGYEVEYRLLYTTPQPSAGVVMPDVKQEIQQKDKRGDYPSQDCYNDGIVDGWNACLDEFARLNGKEVV
jgi:hypothetical protein